MKPKRRVDIIFQHYMIVLEELILDVSYRPAVGFQGSLLSFVDCIGGSKSLNTGSFDASFGFLTSPGSQLA